MPILESWITRCEPHLSNNNPKLGLDCNLGKDLRKDKRNDQLVKHKDIRLYLLLYISKTIRKVYYVHK